MNGGKVYRQPLKEENRFMGEKQAAGVGAAEDDNRGLCLPWLDYYSNSCNLKVSYCHQGTL